MALPFVSARKPQPSSTVRMMGLGRLAISRQEYTGLAAPCSPPAMLPAPRLHRQERARLVPLTLPKSRWHRYTESRRLTKWLNAPPVTTMFGLPSSSRWTAGHTLLAPDARQDWK